MLAMSKSATTPTPNHASCRMATLPPARPTCSEASVEALRMTRPTAAPSRGQSTFCSKRRSIPTIYLPAEIHAGDLLHEDGVEDLPRDRRRDLPTLAPTLHEDD